MNAAYSAYGPGGASTKVRLYDWFDYFGIAIDRHEYLGRNANPAGALASRPLDVARAERDLRRRARWGGERITIVSREASPLSTGRVEADLLSSAGHGIFDFDDAIWLPVAGPRRWLNQERKTQRAVTAADVVIAGNGVLADWASRHASNVIVIPSCVQPGAYSPKSTWELGEAPRMVWLGSPSTEQYVLDIAPALDRICMATGASLTVISGPARRPRALDKWEWVRRVEWSPEVARAELAASDIAIAPLRDDDYTRGKCAYKLLQYAAAALPIVGAPVGANRLALDRFDGLAAVGHEQWVEAITALLAEPSWTRAARGRQGLEAVGRYYSFDAWAAQWSRAVGMPDG